MKDYEKKGYIENLENVSIKSLHKYKNLSTLTARFLNELKI